MAHSLSLSVVGGQGTAEKLTQIGQQNWVVKAVHITQVQDRRWAETPCCDVLPAARFPQNSVFSLNSWSPHSWRGQLRFKTTTGKQKSDMILLWLVMGWGGRWEPPHDVEQRGNGPMYLSLSVAPSLLLWNGQGQGHQEEEMSP